MHELSCFIHKFQIFSSGVRHVDMERQIVQHTELCSEVRASLELDRTGVDHASYDLDVCIVEIGFLNEQPSELKDVGVTFFHTEGTLTSTCPPSHDSMIAESPFS